MSLSFSRARPPTCIASSPDGWANRPTSDPRRSSGLAALLESPAPTPSRQTCRIRTAHTVA